VPRCKEKRYDEAKLQQTDKLTDQPIVPANTRRVTVESQTRRAPDHADASVPAIALGLTSYLPAGYPYRSGITIIFLGLFITQVEELYRVIVLPMMRRMIPYRKLERFC